MPVAITAAHGGKVEDKAFIRNSAESKFEPVVDKFQESLNEEIDKAFKKLGRNTPE